MKKIIAVLIAAVMLAVFVAPTAAFAAKGDNGKTPPGQAKKAAAAEEADVDTEAKVKGNKNKTEAEDEEFEAPGQAKKGFDVEASEETSGTNERVRTGVENAVSRIEANLFKAQDKFIEGTRKIMPPGLLKVYEKFLGWLGFEPAEDLMLDGEATGDGLEEKADDADDADDEDDDEDADDDAGDDVEDDEAPDLPEPDDE